MKTESDPQHLVRAARAAARRAYCPYSEFRVGAALLTKDGTVFTGSNVENASYGLTACAERVAFFSAAAAGHRKFTAIAIVGGRRAPAWPCGACRQVMAEFCGADFPVHIASLKNPSAFKTARLGDLLPHAFKL